jgi:molybdopterin-biosynthesis enzyme MoeA-like protein
MNFYSVIIGSELLNGRRKDKHFEFLNNELLQRGWTHKGSFIIKDEPEFIENTFKLIQADANSVMFSFGGIGATPDDYTRKCAANVFRNGQMELNTKALQCIVDKFGDDAYPHRIHMADLPINAQLLHNPVSNVPGFYLDSRFFFVPGFPQMAQAMILEALDKHYPKNEKSIFRLTLSTNTSENDFIDVMKTINKGVDFSSLPIMDGDKRYTVLSVASNDKELTTHEFNKFINYCKTHQIEYSLTDIKQNK